jgi:3-deoxy-alpha-D-manno-octulosonate 8-oxidase
MKNSKLVQFYFLGSKALNELEPLLSQKRNNKESYVVFIIDHFFKGNSLINKLPILKNDVVIFADTTDEPTSDQIDNIAGKLRGNEIKPSAIIGIGGGSSLDIAKAVSILLTNLGNSVDYQGWNLVQNKPIYKIGIPTISGTGAEFTRTAVLTSPIKKLGINSDYSVFDQVILDPDLLKTVPKDQFIYTAMDCFVHNVESLRGSQNDAMTIALAEKSLEIMKSIFSDQMDHEKLMVASVLGGIAVANSNVGICHPLSYGLSLVLGLHHGYSICIAFNQLEEYYPEVALFRTILKKNNIELPKIISDKISDADIDRMADATLKNERPLENAFGKEWKSIFTKEKVISLIKKM